KIWIILLAISVYFSATFAKHLSAFAVKNSDLLSIQKCNNSLLNIFDIGSQFAKRYRIRIVYSINLLKADSVIGGNPHKTRTQNQGDLFVIVVEVFLKQRNDFILENIFSSFGIATFYIQKIRMAN